MLPFQCPHRKPECPHPGGLPAANSSRNPWNEYECGNWYARAMSSYALLAALSGFRYSFADRTLFLAPKLTLNQFESFFSTATGFGTITLDTHNVTIHILEGELALQKFVLTQNGQIRTIEWNETVRANANGIKAI
jgi:hypothetical protein